MYNFIGFDDLKVGQRVKIKGKGGEDGTFNAMEINIRPAKYEAEIESVVQSIDRDSETLRVLNRDVNVRSDTVVKDLHRNNIDLQGLNSGDMLKLKGAYSAADGFKVEKIKMRESMGFNVDELQGVINTIDPAGKTLDVVGFTVEVSDKTTIQGF